MNPSPGLFYPVFSFAKNRQYYNWIKQTWIKQTWAWIIQFLVLQKIVSIIIGLILRSLIFQIYEQLSQTYPQNLKFQNIIYPFNEFWNFFFSMLALHRGALLSYW